MLQRNHQHHRGAVLLIVLWAIAVAAVVTASIQLFSTRQATLGRDAVTRVQARWAARGGVEQLIAVMESHTAIPVANDAWAMVKDMEYVSSGQLIGAKYDIRHQVDGNDWAGPVDAQAKMNINTMDNTQWYVLRDISPDIIDAILDWKDKDDEPRQQGAEESYYANLRFPYKPRNADFQNIEELELVAGVWPEFLRGADWNLNARLDPNENDGESSWPIDSGDGILDAGWSAWRTARSMSGGVSGSGMPRLYLKKADAEEIAERCGVSDPQAQILKAFGSASGNTLGMLLTTPLNEIGADGKPQQQQNRGRRGRNQAQPTNQDAATVDPLSIDQMRAVFSECTMDNPNKPLYGKMNINTAPESLMRELFPNDQALVDDIVTLRKRTQGIGNMADLLEIRGVSDQNMSMLIKYFDVYSNVYTISSIGRSEASGTQVEMIVTVDRSTLPARIIEYREQ